MGYVEDIKKINALAKELLHHNIVGSQDEAVLKAKEMLVKKNVSSPTVQTESYVDLSKNPLPEEQKREEWKDAMGKNNEYIITELKHFRSTLDTLTNELQTIRNELNGMKKQNTAANTAVQNTELTEQREYTQQYARPVQTTPLPTPPERGAQEVKIQVTQPHPRAGNYKPEDVSVEKFFYFGTKK